MRSGAALNGHAISSTRSWCLDAAVKLERRPVSVPALIAEAQSLLSVSLPPGVELVIREPTVAAVVSGEPEQLQQVIFNLCNNAAQAMDNVGRIELEADVVDLTEPRSLSQASFRRDVTYALW